MIDRAMISQTVIIFAVCAGGWMTFVQPAMHEVSKLEQAIELGRSNATNVQNTHATSISRLPEVRRDLAEIRRRNRAADDSSKLYGLIMDLAAESGVIVQRLQPGRDPGDRKSVRVSEIDMAIQGDYEQVARFLDSLDQVEAYLRPRSLQLSPLIANEREIVLAQFGCELLQFRIKDDLAKMETD